jgi:signal transduction histidine kinase
VPNSDQSSNRNENSNKQDPPERPISPRPPRKTRQQPQITLAFGAEQKPRPPSELEQLQYALSAVPIVFLATDLEERIVLLVGGGLASLPHSRQSFLMGSFFNLYPDNVTVRGQYARALKGEIVSLMVNLGGRAFETTLFPLRSTGGDIAGVLGMGIDLTGRSAEQAGKSQTIADDHLKEKLELVAHASHELKTPLNSIVGFTSLLARNAESHFSEQDLYYIQRILGNATHLLNVAGEMLNYSAVESGQVKVAVGETDLEGLIEETIAEMRGHPRAWILKLSAEVPSDVRSLETDRQKLKQVLVNLLANALKFTEKGSVTVRVVADEFHRPVRIDVIDTGVGIQPEKVESVFEAYERGDQAAAKEIEGAGLGLTISRSLCELMGYTISLESKPGSGSTFSIHLRPRDTL